MPIQLIEGLGDQLENQSSLDDIQVCSSAPQSLQLHQRFGFSVLPTKFSDKLTQADIQDCWQRARVEAAKLKKSGTRVTAHDIQRIAITFIKQLGDELDRQPVVKEKKPVKRKFLRKKSNTSAATPAFSGVSNANKPASAAPAAQFKSAAIRIEESNRTSSPVDPVKMRLTWQGKSVTSKCLRVIDDPNFVVFVYSGDSDSSLLYLKTPSAYETCRLRIRYDGIETTRRVLSGACRFQDGGHKYVMFIVVPDSL